MSEKEIVLEERKRAKPKSHSPKVWQVQKFYELLCEVGMDDWVSSALELRKEKLAKNGAKPVKAQDQRTSDDEVEFSADDFIQLSVHIDLGRIMSYLGKNGGLIQFVSIVMDVSEEEAAKLSLEDFHENFTDFVVDSLKPITMLLGFGQNLG